MIPNQNCLTKKIVQHQAQQHSPLSASNNLDLDVGCRPHVLTSSPIFCIHAIVLFLHAAIHYLVFISLSNSSPHCNLVWNMLSVRRSQQPTHCWNCTPQLWLVYLPLVSHVYALKKFRRHNRFPLDENINPALYNTVCFESHFMWLWSIFYCCQSLFLWVSPPALIKELVHNLHNNKYFPLKA